MTTELNPEIIQFMNRDQKLVINEIKKAINRIKYKEYAGKAIEDSTRIESTERAD